MKNVLVLGAGAVGTYFGGMIARAGHQRVMFYIPRESKVQAIEANKGVQMNCKSFQEKVPIEMTSDLSGMSPDVILLAVKGGQTSEALSSLRPHLDAAIPIVSLQNGVHNSNVIREAFLPMNPPVIAATVFVACEMVDDVTLQHHGRGELVIGEELTTPSSPSLVSSSLLDQVSDMFNQASVPCSISANIKDDMWKKMNCNCAYNAISAIGNITYGELYRVPSVKKLIEGIVREYVAVAQKEGVNLTYDEAMKLNDGIFESMGTQKSSTQQDLARGRRTEIDYLNGYIHELGEKHGVLTPYNQAVHALVKMAEAKLGLTLR